MMTEKEFYETYEDALQTSPYGWYETGYTQGEYDVDEWVSKCADLASENAALKTRLDLVTRQMNKYKGLYQKLRFHED